MLVQCSFLNKCVICFSNEVVLLMKLDISESDF